MQDYSGYGQPPFGSTSPLPPMPPMPPPPRRRTGFLSYLVVAVVAGALGAGSVVALYHPTSNNTSAAAPQPSTTPTAPTPMPSTAIPQPSSGGVAGNASQTAILNKVEPGLVIINTTLQYNSEQAAGTGMVINQDGLVLTNNHVIEDSTSITATDLGNGHRYTAKIIGYDVTGDVALIQLQNASGLRTVPIGDSKRSRTAPRCSPWATPRARARSCPRPAGDRAGPDHHRERLGRLDHLGDPARHDPDRRERRVR